MWNPFASDDEDTRSPAVGDRVLYRGRYRDIIGFQAEPEAPLTNEMGRIVVYRNPRTKRNTYSRTEDLEYSEHYGAWYPVGLLLHRAECALYAALPGTAGKDVPEATAHESAARMLDEQELTLEEMSEDERDRLERKVARYWPDEDGRPNLGDVLGAARQLRQHRQEEF